MIADDLPTPDSLFSNWQSLELFGVPGAGKSFYCRRALSSAAMFTTCDDQVARHYMNLGKGARFLQKTLPPLVFKNYTRWKADRTVDDVLRHQPAGVRAYLSAVEAAIAYAILSESTKKNVRDSIRRTAAYLALAQQDGLRLLVDEGLVRKLWTMIARSGGNTINPALADAIVRCLQAYPWQKNALVIDVPQSVALERQSRRGHIISNRGNPIEDFGDAVERLFELLHQSGWTVARIKNG